MDVADKTRDELIDELVKSEQREMNLVEDVNRAQRELGLMTDALEQSANRDVQQNLTDALAKAERLWVAINKWYDQHKRGCQYAMQPGGFCAECVWVKRIIDTEEKLEAAPLGEKAT